MRLSMSGPVKESWCILSFKCWCNIKLFELFGIVKFHQLQMSRVDSFTSILLSNPLLYFSAMRKAGFFILTGFSCPSAE